MKKLFKSIAISLLFFMLFGCADSKSSLHEELIGKWEGEFVEKNPHAGLPLGDRLRIIEEFKSDHTVHETVYYIKGDTDEVYNYEFNNYNWEVNDNDASSGYFITLTDVENQDRSLKFWYMDEILSYTLIDPTYEQYSTVIYENIGKLMP